MNWKKIGITVSVIVIPIFLFIFITFKPWLRAPSARDYFFFDVAIDFKVPDICEKIHPWSYAGAGWGGEITVSYTRSDCYYHLALILRNAELCDRIRPLKWGESDGSRYKEVCIRNVKRGIPGLGTTHVGYYDEEKMMRLTGFSDYLGLKHGPQREKEKFLDAVRRL